MKIITICGSLKYKEIMMKEAENLSIQGNCVLTPIYPTACLSEYNKDDIKTLGNMHLERINISDAIYVVNVDNYIGESTKREIDYAKSLNKEIIYYTDKTL